MSQAQALLLLKLLDLAIAGISAAPDVIARVRQGRSKLEAMIQEGRDPTPDEMAEIDADIAGLRERLHGGAS